MDGRRGRTSVRQDHALRQRRTSGSAGQPGAGADTSTADRVDGSSVVVLPDTDAGRAAEAAEERLARARQAADEARDARRVLQARIEQQRSRLLAGRTAAAPASPSPEGPASAGPGPAPAGPATATRPTADDGPSAAPSLVPAWAGTTTAGRALRPQSPQRPAPATTRPPVTGAPDRPSARAVPIGTPPPAIRTAKDVPAAVKPSSTTSTTSPAATGTAAAPSRPAPPRPAPPRPAPPRPAAPVDAAVAPGAAPASSDERPRHRLLLFVIAVVVAVVALGLIRAQQDEPFVDPAADPAGTASTQASGSDPAAPMAGELQVAATLQEEAVDVQEVTRYIAERPTEVQLRLPTLAGLNGPIRTAQLGVADLEVTLDGEPVTPEQDPEQPGTWLVQQPDGSGFTEMRVGYRLEGALLTNALSAPGRLLAVLGPLSSDASVGSAAVTIRGEGVINVYCPGQAADQLLCATQTDDAWDATLPSPSPVEPVLLVQVDRS